MTRTKSEAKIENTEVLSSMMEAMISMLDDETSRKNAFFVLSQESALPIKVFQKLATLLKSDEPSIREGAFSTLYNKSSMPEEIEQKVFSLLDDPDYKVREAVLSQILFRLPESEFGLKQFIGHLLASADENLHLKVVGELKYVKTIPLELKK